MLGFSSVGDLCIRTSSIARQSSLQPCRPKRVIGVNLEMGKRAKSTRLRKFCRTTLLNGIIACALLTIELHDWNHYLV
jgi:hypothetical protein